MTAATDQSNGVVNPYVVLQLRRDATACEIRRAYQRLSLWHHPSRCCNEEERKRRTYVFGVVAACYETLVDPDSRRRCDFLLSRQEKGNSDAKSVAETNSLASLSNDPVLLSCFPGVKNSPSDGDPGIPALVSSFSIDDEDDDDDEPQSPTQQPIVSSVSLSLGPLSILYRSRHYHPFTDPYLVFERVFGSSLGKPPADAPRTLEQHSTPLRHTPFAAWKGESSTLPDGSRVFTTTRVLHNRQFTRTEVVNHGRLEVSVQAEEIETILPPPPDEGLFWRCHASRIFCGDDETLPDDWNSFLCLCGELFPGM